MRLSDFKNVRLTNLCTFVAVFVGSKPRKYRMVQINSQLQLPSFLPNKPIVIEIQPERVDAGHEDIETEVELSLVDQVRPGHVSLDNKGPSPGYLTPFVHHFDASASRKGGGLHNPPEE